MKILVTGSNGFVGKNLVVFLKRKGYEVLPFDVDTKETLESLIDKADFIIHLAGVNRPLTIDEFYDGNTNLTKKLVDLVKDSKRNIPIIYSSSIQAALDNDYGRSKKQAEVLLIGSELPVYVYRLANVFGKWCKPNYNSALSTFMYNIAHDLPITVNDPKRIVHFNYVDDICNTWIDILDKGIYLGSGDILKVEPTYDVSLGTLDKLIHYFKRCIDSDVHLPIIKNDFELKLFITFCDYYNEIEGQSLNYAKDERGYFMELYKNKNNGQISINSSNIGITKGNHYHTYKEELFYVVKGYCLIEQRNINNNKRIKNKVKAENKKIVKILPNYTHNITNIGNEESLTLMWISEVYSDKTSDTYKCEVNK